MLVLVAAAAIMVIRWVAAGTADALVYLAVAVILAGFAPWLLAAGIIWRRNTAAWAIDEQRLRDHMADKRALEDRVHQLEQLLTGSGVRALPPGADRRGRRPSTQPRGSTTGRHRAVSQEDEP